MDTANTKSKTRLTAEEIVKGALTHRAVQEEQELLALVNLLLERKIENVCEIGTYCGGTLWAWCQIATGFIASIDYGDVPRDDFVEWYDRRKLWTPKMNTRNPNLWFALVECCPELDFLFVDGGHSYSDAKWDYEQFSPLVRKGGIIAFHDIALVSPSPDYECKKFWDELKMGKDYREFIGTGHMGIGAILT
jgi:hypothetical protein